jgi:hypothetical protein
VELEWIQPEPVTQDGAGKRFSFKVRREPVALLSNCCDLVIRDGLRAVQISPLREIPKNVLRKVELLEVLKMKLAEAEAARRAKPPGLFYFGPGEGPNGYGPFGDRVVYFEAGVAIPPDVLKNAKKIAELREDWRAELRERLAFFYGRSP